MCGQAVHPRARTQPLYSGSYKCLAETLFSLNTPSHMALETQHFLKLQIHLDHLCQQADMRSDNLSTTIPKNLSRH